MSLKSVKGLLSVSSLAQLLHWRVIRNGTRRAVLTQTDWDGTKARLLNPVLRESMVRNTKDGKVLVLMSILT